MSLAVLSLLLAAPPAGDEAALARRLVERIEQRHASTRDLVARFVQGYRSGMLGREVVEKGTVSIKRPGRMHWEYREPERKVFVSDGRVFYFYVPADRQVIIQEQDTERSLAARLLSGRGGGPEAELKRAFIDAELSGRIRSILLEDAQGNRTSFRFEHVRENVGLEDGLFPCAI